MGSSRSVRARAAALLIGAGTALAACSSGGSGAPAAKPTTSTRTPAPPTTGPAASTTTSSPLSTLVTTTTTTTPTTTTPRPAPPAGGPVPAGFSPGSVTFVSTVTGFALGAATSCGARCAALVRTQDGGASWVGLAAPPAPYVPSNEAAGAKGPAVSEVRFADPLDGWAFGPSLFATHDGGRTWRAVELGGAVVSLETSAGYVEAVVSPCAPGGACTGAYRLDQAPAAGGAFRTVLTGPSQRADAAVAGYLSLQRSSGFVLLGYGGGGKSLFATGNVADPRGWNRFPDPCAGTGLGLTSFVAPDTRHLYSLCTGDPAAGSTEKAAVVTLDGRSRVAGRPPAGGDGGTIAATPAGVVLVASYSAATMLYRSTDGGAGWGSALTYGDGGEGLFDLGFTTGTQGVVIHGLPGGAPGERGTLLMTHDAGATWRAVRF